MAIKAQAAEQVMKNICNTGATCIVIAHRTALLICMSTLLIPQQLGKKADNKIESVVSHSG